MKIKKVSKLTVFLTVIIITLVATTIYFATKKTVCPQIKNGVCPAAPQCPNCDPNTPFRQSFLGPLINLFGVKSPLIVKDNLLVSGGNNYFSTRSSYSAPEARWTYDFYKRTLQNIGSGSYLVVKDGVSVTQDSALATRFVFKGSPNQLVLENNPTTCISWDGTNITTAGCDEKSTWFVNLG